MPLLRHPVRVHPASIADPLHTFAVFPSMRRRSSPMYFSKFVLRLLASALIIFGLQACGSASPSPENSAWSGVLLSFNGTRTDPTAQFALSPTTWYLKVQATDSPPALLAFGFIEPRASTASTEVWLSGAGQYIKLQEGRVVGTHGIPGTNWSNVTATPGWPQWSAVAQGPVRFTRARTTMPGYDQGIEETLEVSAIAPPAEAVSSLIAGASDAKASHWRWYRETVISSRRPQLPDAIYATAYLNGSAMVVYSQQCLTNTYCLKMMRWPQLESEPHPW